MGVQGLTTLVEGNRHYFQDVKFRDSRLVIDGCCLYFRLYFNHGLDQQHGGDYDEFAALLNEFFSALATCNIQPYVVLDGGTDPSDKKFSTLRQRLQSKIKEADSISRGHNGSVLPILARNVFIQVLIQRGVPVVQCPAEADFEIACLAHQWNCPVLSYDSDFYIFDLPGGYLPFRFFQWNSLNGKATQRYIPSRRYNTNNLCRSFGFSNKELLPLCAVLAGNDYGIPKEAEKALALLDLSGPGRGGGGRGKGKTTNSTVEGILLWLSSFTCAGKAIEEMNELIGEDVGKGRRGQRSSLSSQLWAGIKEYQIKPHSSLACWFTEGKAAPGGQSPGLSQLPEGLLVAAAQGLLAPQVVDALVLRRVLLVPQVENCKLASSHCSSRAIRQALYGMLLQRDGGVQGGGQSVRGPQGFNNGRMRGQGGRGHISPSQQGAGAATVQPQGMSTIVEEYDRVDLNYQKKQVEVHPPRTTVHLDKLNQASVAMRLGVLLEVLGVKESALAPVPPHLQLAVAVTGYWLREAVPPPSQPLVQALVLGMVYGELCRNNQPGNTNYQHTVPHHLNWASERSLCGLLDRQRVRSGDRRGGGVDLGAAHSLSQWQSCLWSAMCLNQLLLLPLPEPHLSGLFSGTMVHGFLRYLKRGQTAEALLSGRPLSGQLYCSLLDDVKNCSSKANPTSSASGRRRRRGGGRGRGRGGRGGGGRGRGAQGFGPDAEEMNNRFALLLDEEEFSDD